MNTVTQSRYWKGRSGWSAKAVVNLGPASIIGGRTGERILHVETSKHMRGGIVTTASCHLADHEGFLTTVIHSDYYRTIIRTGHRCTEGAVREQHEKVMVGVDAIIAEARAFYVAKETERLEREASEGRFTVDAQKLAVAVDTLMGQEPAQA